MYLDRYQEMFNEIDGDFDNVAIRTFKVGLLAEHGLRKFLAGKPIASVRQLMDQIDKYKRNGKVIPQDMRDFRLDHYNNNRPQKDFAGQSGPIAS